MNLQSIDVIGVVNPQLLLVIVAYKSAIYSVGGAVHVSSFIGCKKSNDGSNIFSGAETAKRDVFYQCIELRLVFQQRFVNRCNDGTGSKIVDGESKRCESNCKHAQ